MNFSSKTFKIPKSLMIWSLGWAMVLLPQPLHLSTRVVQCCKLSSCFISKGSPKTNSEEVWGQAIISLPAVSKATAQRCTASSRYIGIVYCNNNNDLSYLYRLICSVTKSLLTTKDLYLSTKDLYAVAFHFNSSLNGPVYVFSTCLLSAAGYLNFQIRDLF